MQPNHALSGGLVKAAPLNAGYNYNIVYLHIIDDLLDMKNTMIKIILDISEFIVEKFLLGLSCSLVILFIFLKAFDKIDWDMHWVVSPIWIYAIILVVHMFVKFSFKGLETRYIKKSVNDRMDDFFIYISMFVFCILGILKFTNIIGLSWWWVSASFLIYPGLWALYAVISRIFKLKIEPEGD